MPVALLFGAGIVSGQALPKVWPIHIPTAQPLAGKPVVNAPYSGDRIVSEDVLNHKSTSSTREYRDSAGRTRNEEPRLASSHVPEPLAIVTIVDPVAGVQYVLDVENKIAHRQVIPSPPEKVKAPSWRGSNPVPGYTPNDPISGAPTGFAPFPSDSLPPSPSLPRPKKLGSRVIEGLRTEGVRHHIDPQRTEDVWRSPELEVPILSETSSGRLRYKRVEKLVNINRREPDPALFQVPSNYRVVDESGGFTIPISVH